GGTKHDGVRLAERNLVAKGRFKAVEKPGEGRPIQRRALEIDREERRGQAQAQYPFSDWRIFIGLEGIAFDLDLRMAGQEVSEDGGGNGFAQHAEIKCPGAGDYFEGFVRVKERAFDVKNIPEERVIPTVGNGSAR